MQKILDTYFEKGLSKDRISVVPWQSPISSYIPGYALATNEEELERQTEQEAGYLRKMLLGE